MKLVITAPGGGGGGGGGGGDGGSGGGAGGSFRVTLGGKGSPIARLSIKRVQDIDKLTVVARLLERANLTVNATVRTSGAAKLYRFRAVKRTLSAKAVAKVRLRIAKAKLRAIKGVLRRGKRLRAKITVSVITPGGRKGVVTRTVRLTP